MQRLSPGTLILGIFAILFGLVGAYAVKKYTQPAPVEASPPPEKAPTYRVPVAVVDLPVGRTITEGDVAVLTFTAADLAKAKFTRGYMQTVSQIIGRTLREPLKQGRPFVPESLYPMGIGPSVAELLQPGERALTVPFDATAAQATVISPGAVVDVIFRTKADVGRRLPEATVTLLSRVRVLAVGQSIQDGVTPAPKASSTVTLAVNEIQARALETVEGQGTLTLALRNAKDGTPPQKAAPTTLPDLLGIRQPEVATTQIYRRGHLTTLTFQDGQRQMMVAEPAYGLPVTGPSQTPPSPPAAPSPADNTMAPGPTQPGVRVLPGVGGGNRPPLSFQGR